MGLPSTGRLSIYGKDLPKNSQGFKSIIKRIILYNKYAFVRALI